MNINPAIFRQAPFKHQLIGMEALLRNEYFMLGDEMGAGKTFQTIGAAQLLYQAEQITRVVVVAPASVVDVWFNQELGELAKHLFVPSTIQHFHGRWRGWNYGEGTERLAWIISNYEFIRAEHRLEELLDFCTMKTMLVLDESSAIKNYRAAQTRACANLRRQCGRVVLLNGTPIANSPMDMYSQGLVMHPDILCCRGITHFRARYAEMGGYEVKTPWGSRATQIVGWKNLDDLQRRFAPFVLRRLKKDCLDLPPVLPPVIQTATLTEPTWKLYKEMRDSMVAWLNDLTVSVAPQTITKVMRLSQITSGIIGGVEAEIPEGLNDDRPAWLPDVVDPPVVDSSPLQEVGREKLDVHLEWLDQMLEEDPDLKLLVWCRFIPELRRLLKEWKIKFPNAKIGAIAGQSMLGQPKKDERAEALRLLDPRTAPTGPVFVGGTYGTGSLGLNLTACHTMVNLSFDYSYWKSVQSAARVDRPGQTSPISMFDVVAEGPRGQRTIDHTIVKALRDKSDIAIWTTSAWVKALMEE